MKPFVINCFTSFTFLFIDRKSCANIDDRVEEVAYNAASFQWDTKVNAKVRAMYR